MWKAVLTLLISTTLAVSAVRAQGQDPTHWVEKLVVGYEKEGPSVLTKDFGIVAKGGHLLHTFKLYNPYGVPLTIRTHVECSCVTVAPVEFVIQSKQTVDFNITMDTTRFSGNKQVHIDLFSGPPPYNQKLTLLVMAQIRADLVLNPGLINLGNLKSGQASAPQSLDVEYAGATDFRISEVVDHNAPVKISFKELYRHVLA